MQTRRLETALTATLAPLVTAAVLALHKIAMHRVSCSPGDLAHLLCCNGLWQGDGHLKLVRVTAGPVTSRSSLHRQADASSMTQGSLTLHSHVTKPRLLSQVGHNITSNVTPRNMSV